MNTKPENQSPHPDQDAATWACRFRRLAETLRGAGSLECLTTPFDETPEGYGRAVLHRDASIEIIAIRWPAGVASALHGHGGSAVWLEILQGSLIEDRFLPMGETLVHQTQVVAAGQSAYLPVGALHRVVGVTDSLALHAYSPPLAEPATPPTPTEQARILNAWRYFEAAHRGAPLPSFLASLVKRSPA